MIWTFLFFGESINNHKNKFMKQIKSIWYCIFDEREKSNNSIPLETKKKNLPIEPKNKTDIKIKQLWDSVLFKWYSCNELNQLCVWCAPIRVAQREWGDRHWHTESVSGAILIFHESNTAKKHSAELITVSSQIDFVCLFRSRPDTRSSLPLSDANLWKWTNWITVNGF